MLANNGSNSWKVEKLTLLFSISDGAVLSIAQIIKFVMTSAAKSKLVALFITAREMIPHRQTLINMGWPQPKSPIQTDNSTAAGVTKNTIVPHRSKMMDMRLWWLHWRTCQDQFCYYWDAGTKNWADYNTKHHPETFFESHHSTHAGIWVGVGTWYPPTHQTTGPQVSPHRFSHFFFLLTF